MRTSRREFLSQLGALGAGALLPVRPVWKGKIDVHYHIGQVNARGTTRQALWSPERAIEDMDQGGVAAGICSTGGGGGGARGGAERIRQAREWNESAAKLGRDYPGRFGHFATLPLPDIDGSLKEIDYALRVFKADGFGLVTSYGDMWLGDPMFRPVMMELNRRKAAVFVHTTDAACCTPATMTYEKPPLSGAWIEWPMNTARTIFSLMISGVLREFSDIRFIFAHSGGVMPLLIARISAFSEWDSVGPDTLRRLFPDGIENEFRRCYFEIAQGFSPINFDALRKLVPVSHILFGSDYPFFSTSHSAKGLDELKLPPDVKTAIERDNAAALLPRWN